MSLHSYAIDWIARHIDGVINDTRYSLKVPKSFSYSKRIKTNEGLFWDCSVCDKRFSAQTSAQFCCNEQKGKRFDEWEKKSREKKFYRIGGCIPDVVKEVNPNRPNRHLEFHEVQVLDIPEKRIESWSMKYPRGGGKHSLIPNSSKRFLWIVLPNGSIEAFDKIKIIEKQKFGEFKELV